MAYEGLGNGRQSRSASRSGTAISTALFVSAGRLCRGRAAGCDGSVRKSATVGRQRSATTDGVAARALIPQALVAGSRRAVLATFRCIDADCTFLHQYLNRDTLKQSGYRRDRHKKNQYGADVLCGYLCTRGLWNKKEHAHHALRKHGTRKNKTNHKTKPPRCTRQHIFSRGGRGAHS